MKKFKWSVILGAKCVGTGTLVAKSEKEGVEQILRKKDLPIQPDECYSVNVGDCTMSSYGDEFDYSANAMGNTKDEVQLTYVEETTHGVQGGGPVNVAIGSNAGNIVTGDEAVRALNEATTGSRNTAIGSGVMTVAEVSICPETYSGAHQMVTYSPTRLQICSHCGLLQTAFLGLAMDSATYDESIWVERLSDSLEAKVTAIGRITVGEVVQIEVDSTGCTTARRHK